MLSAGRFRKILVIKTRAIGDTVLLTVPLAELRRAFPEAEIQALVAPAGLPVLQGNPILTKIRSFDRSLVAFLRLAWQLRAERFDCVVNFHASPSTSLLARLTGARVRSVHFHGHADANRFSTVVVPGKGRLKPIIERDLDAVRALGVEAGPGMPKIFLDEEEKIDARAALEGLGLRRPLLMMGLGASRPAKSWPLECFAELAIRWAAGTGGGVLATAGPDEQELVDRFLSKTKGSAHIVGRADFSLRQLAAMLPNASVFCGNDSGPRHVAVAVGTPTVTLFGPEHPFEWHPYPPDLHPYFFVEDLSCRKDAGPGMPQWCGLVTCTEHDRHAHQCMSLIPVEQVFNECRRMVTE